MVDRRSCATWTPIYLTFFVQPAHKKMLDRADTTELVEKKETPATKHSRLQKRRPNNRQVVEDTSEEEAQPQEDEAWSALGLSHWIHYYTRLLKTQSQGRKLKALEVKKPLPH